MLPFQLVLLPVCAAAAIAASDPVFHWSPQDNAREFSRPDDAILIDLRGKFTGAEAGTIETWVLPRRTGEQTFVGRGLPEIGPGGERFFRRAEGWVKFFVGTDARGF